MTKAFENGYNHLILNFPNGNSISSIWGWGSYTENYGELADPEFKTFLASNDVEVSVTCSKMLFKKLQRRYKTTSTVFGHITIKQWVKLISDVSSEPPNQQR